MNDEHDPQEPVGTPPPPPPPPPSAPPQPAYAAAPARPRVPLREQSFGVGALSIVAVVALLLGGLVGGLFGVVVGFAVHGARDDHPRMMIRPGDGPMQRWDGPGRDFKQQLPQPAQPPTPSPTTSG